MLAVAASVAVAMLVVPTATSAFGPGPGNCTITFYEDAGCTKVGCGSVQVLVACPPWCRSPSS